MIRPVPLERQHLLDMGAGDAVENLNSPGRAWTLMEDDRPIAAGGIIITSEGVGAVWTFINDYCRSSARIMRRIHWIAKNYLEDCKEFYRLERIQADTLKEDGRSCRWMEAFGFTLEGDMPKYFQGKTYTRWAWIRED